MKATLEFTLPDEREEYADAVNGWKYRVAIQDAINAIKEQIDSGDSGNDSAFIAVRGIIYKCCEDNGFDVWDVMP
jgi:hypothetical protein